MKTFVTIFPYLKNAHLIKDVGMIPWYLQHSELYNTRIVAYETPGEFSHLQQEAQDLTIEQIPYISHKKIWQSGMADYLRRNAAKIDVLNLYHLTTETFIYALIYKQYHPSGKIYLKADVYNKHLTGKKYHRSVIKNMYYRNIARRAMRIINIISVENKAAIALFKQRYPVFKGKLLYLPNGVNDVFIRRCNMYNLPFAEKKNRIIISGRIGAPEKNHEILLQVIPKLHLNDWQFVFAGTIDPTFSQKIKTLFTEYPALKKQIIFTGEITDRNILYEHYRQAKVSCLTSEYESFGLSLVEGLYFGHFLLGTDNMYAFDDLTAGGKFGRKLPFNDAQALQMALQSLINGEWWSEQESENAARYARKNFVWSKITKQLVAVLNDE